MDPRSPRVPHSIFFPSRRAKSAQGVSHMSFKRRLLKLQSARNHIPGHQQPPRPPQRFLLLPQTHLRHGAALLLRLASARSLREIQTGPCNPPGVRPTNNPPPVPPSLPPSVYQSVRLACFPPCVKLIFHHQKFLRAVTATKSPAEAQTCAFLDATRVRPRGAGRTQDRCRSHEVRRSHWTSDITRVRACVRACAVLCDLEDRRSPLRHSSEFVHLSFSRAASPWKPAFYDSES